MPNNEVTSIAIEGTTIWIGTDWGVASYTGQGIEESSEFRVQSLELKVEPNPVFGNAVVKYGLQEKANVSLVLYDISGRLVKYIYSGVKEKGYYEVNIKENKLSNGVYFIKFSAGNYKTTKKVTVIR